VNAPVNARRYFRRSGLLLLFAAAVIAIIGALAAPDTLGRGFAAVFVLGALAAGALRLRKAYAVSPTAIVRETGDHRPGFLFGVGYTVEDPNSTTTPPPRGPDR
jgi:hypothetical protein